jgi:hypothetical protein
MVRKLKYQIEGLEKENGNVRLTVFADKISALRRVIREASIESRGEDTRKLVVQDLSHSSPAAITIAGPQKIVDPITICIATAFHQIQVGTFKAFTRFGLLEAIDDLVRGAGSAFGDARLTFDADEPFNTFSINKTLAEKIARLKLPDIESLGSAKGRIEIVNIHADQHKFYVYRPAGKQRSVMCTFSDELLEKAKEALGRTVTVRGRAKYERDSLLPTEIDVTAIDVHEQDDDLPTMSELIGKAPGATGELSTLAFIEGIRRGTNA